MSTEIVTWYAVYGLAFPGHEDQRSRLCAICFYEDDAEKMIHPQGAFNTYVVEFQQPFGTDPQIPFFRDEEPD